MQKASWKSGEGSNKLFKKDMTLQNSCFYCVHGDILTKSSTKKIFQNQQSNIFFLDVLKKKT